MEAASGDAAAQPMETELATSDALQLWTLARVLMEQNLVQQATLCLEALCAAAEKMDPQSTEEHDALVCGNILLAEVYLVACSSSHASKDRELRRRRVQRADKCTAIVDLAIKQGYTCSIEWMLRLSKVRFLLVQISKVDRATKNMQTLEILCSALQRCSKNLNAEEDVRISIAEFRQYFGYKLKACLVKLYAVTNAERGLDASTRASLLTKSLQFVRAQLANDLDSEFLLWIIEISCHAESRVARMTNEEEVRSVIQLGDELFQSVKLEKFVAPEFQSYHLILRGFFCLRTGSLKDISVLLEEIDTLKKLSETTNGATSNVKETYLDSVVDALRLYVLACTDPCQALIMSKDVILSGQASVRKYQAHPAVSVLLMATLLDMLYLHCRLQAIQCRYFEMGTAIAQMVEIFAGFKSHLIRTVYYRFFVARIHLLIAQYGVATGRVKEACSHLNYIVDKLLPRFDDEGADYPDLYLSIWVGTVEVGTSCSLPVNRSPDLQQQPRDTASVDPVNQIYPHKVLLEWSARVLKRAKLRDLIYGCSNMELRAKYDTALAKWLWATRDLLEPSDDGATADQPITPHASLEAIRPRMASLLRETLERSSKQIGCGQLTAEIMALLGPKLIAHGKLDSGEEILSSAIRTAIHSKNVLLQARLLADIFRLYGLKKHSTAQATTAAQYEKKRGVLQRRVQLAQAEQASSTAILRWTSGSIVASEDAKIKREAASVKKA